ncbi:MAG: PAS domain S-box protein, partial [Acidobacteriota bacterium]|nr:PAS domain S-box protein [Acidobacteriota bacterium]
VRDEGGGLLYYEGFVKNISARRRAERAVKLAPTLMLAGLSALAALALIEIAQHLLMRLISEGVSLSIPIIFGSFAAVGITYFALKRQAALYRRTFMESAERKRAEEGRRHSEEKYRAIFDNASMGIFQSAPDGTLLTANSALARLLGYDSTEELLLRNLAEDVYYRKEDREELIARYEPDGAAADLELLWKRRDGSPVWVHLNFRAVKDEGGRTLHFEGFVHDVTERRRAEEALRESEGRYKGLIDSAFDGVVIHRDGVIRDANRAYAEMFGYGVEEFVGLDILELTPPEQRDLVLSKFKDAGRTYEAQGLKKDGTRIDIEVSPTECVYEGWPARMAAVRDITERKQTEEALRKSEEQLRQSQKLEAVGQLAGGVAHDFNNLLTVITGYSDILLRRFGQGDPARPKVEEIKKAAGRAASLTRQLLAFSRRQTLQPKVLDLNVLVADVSKMLRRLIGEDVEMVLALGTKAGLVKADPGQIEQVLMNLAVNARDAMPRGGKLTVETKSVYLDEGYARHHIAVNPGPYVMLAVSDTGTGMDAETQARAFEPFFTTKEVGKGTGLGLSTVYGIVKQSGGYVWVYSEVGHGTTFKIYLPTVGEVAGAEEPAALPDVPGGSETVLLVEDEEMVRDLSREILEEGGYTVIVARDGLEGLRVCREFEGRIDLVITDVVMPQAGGRELAEKAAALRPNAKVLYMSGYTEDAVVRHGVLEEEMPFIQKPFTPDALTRKVREVLDK